MRKRDQQSLFTILCNLLLLFSGCTSSPSEEICGTVLEDPQNTVLYTGKYDGLWSTDEATLCNDEIEVVSNLIYCNTSYYKELLKCILKDGRVELSTPKQWNIPCELIGITDQTLYFRLFVDTVDINFVINGEPCIAQISFTSASNSTQSSWMMYSINACRFSIFLKVNSWSIVSSLDGRVLESGNTPFCLKFITTKKTKK